MAFVIPSCQVCHFHPFPLVGLFIRKKIGIESFNWNFIVFTIFDENGNENETIPRLRGHMTKHIIKSANDRYKKNKEYNVVSPFR